MVNKVYIEDAEDFMRESKTYRKILEHRRKCSKWGKKFCLECFGGGLTLFTENLMDEFYFHSRQDKEFRLTRDCSQFNSPADKLKSGGTHREN